MRWLSIRVAMVVALCASLASAEDPPRYSLSWVRGAGADTCPNERALAQEIERRVGHSVFAPEADRSVEASVARSGLGFRIDIHVRDGEGRAIGERALGSEDPTCGPTFSAAALALALLIDPDAVARNDANASTAVARFDVVEVREPEPAPTPMPEVPPPLPVALPAPDCPQPQRRLPLTLSGGGLYSGGLVPDASPGVGLLFGGQFSGVWGWAVSTLYVFEARTQDTERGDFGVSATAGSLSVTAKLLNIGPFTVLVGIGPVLGVLHTVVYAPVPDEPGDYLLVGAQAESRARFHLSDVFFAELGAVGWVPFIRRGLVIEDTAPAWRQPAVSGFGFLGVGASIL